MRKRSLTRRLIVSVVLVQLVLTGAVLALAMYLTQVQLRKSFDEELHGRAMAIAALVRYSEDDPPHLVFDPTMVPPSLDRHHADQYQILGTNGEVITSSPGWARFASKSPAATPYQTIELDGRTYREIRLEKIPVLDEEAPGVSPPDRITVSYVSSTGGLRERAGAVALFTLLGSLALLAIATAVVVWSVKRDLSPLAGLAASAGRVNAHDWALDAPAEARSMIELSPLTDAMDEMLANLQRAFTAEREFVANAAHELKTPITVVKSTLQLALQRERTAAEYRKQLQDALDDVARLESLAHSLLRLARAEQLRPARRAALPGVDIAASCEQVAERWRPAAQAKSVRIEVLASGHAEIRGDSDDLDLIWSNLLDNAIRYSPAGSQVVVKFSRDNGSARVDIHDEGPGIAPDELSNIFRRFHRGDASRSRETGGYGLGLSIAKAMAEAYGGTIDAESRPGAGSTFTVRLPVLS